LEMVGRVSKASSGRRCERRVKSYNFTRRLARTLLFGGRPCLGFAGGDKLPVLLDEFLVRASRSIVRCSLQSRKFGRQPLGIIASIGFDRHRPTPVPGSPRCRKISPFQ